MIQIDRYREEDGAPIQPSAGWFEAAGEKTELAVAEGADHEVDDHYKHDEVKAALEALFYFKCAYCETPLGDEWEVEHYRPKGRVAEAPDHPGYYWLAYDWENLYPACKSCNQHRKDKPLWGDPATLPAAGKADQFPLVVEEDRATGPEDELDHEQPYLLDPNVDNPELHLSYTPTGRIFALDQDPFGEESILICHLSRRRLTRRRARAIATMIRHLRLLASIDPQGYPQTHAVALDEVSRLMADDAAYAGAARAVYNDPDAFGV